MTLASEYGIWDDEYLMNEIVSNPSSKEYFWKMLKAEVLLRSFNRTAVWNLPKKNWLLGRLFGSMDGKPYLVQNPFHVGLECYIQYWQKLSCGMQLLSAGLCTDNYWGQCVSCSQCDDHND